MEGWSSTIELRPHRTSCTYRNRPSGQVGKDATVEVEVLNLWCADGVRSCKLSEVQRLRFLNPSIDSEFRKALAALRNAPVLPAGGRCLRQKTPQPPSRLANSALRCLSMKTTVERESPTKVRLLVEVEPSEIDKLTSDTVRKLSQEFKVPGFRKGKVPRQVLESRMGRDAIRQRMLEESLPRLYTDAAKEESLRPAATPDI